MVLESLNPIENDKPLKKIFFFLFGGVWGPPKPHKNLKMGVFGAVEHPPKSKKIFFFKGLSFSMGFKLSRTIFIFDLQ